MKKRLLSLCLAAALCLTLLPTAAWAEEADPVGSTSAAGDVADDSAEQEGIAALAANNQVTDIWFDDVNRSDGTMEQGPQKWTADPLESTTGSVTWGNNTNYVVGKNQEVTINGDLTIDGTSIRLILFDGAKLTITGSLILKQGGLSIWSHTETLNSKDIGQIIIENSVPSGAAIRSDRNAMLSFCGGKLTAKGSEFGTVSKVFFVDGIDVMTATLGGEALSPADFWDETVTLSDNKDLVIEWCSHSKTQCTSVSNTKHQECCLDCNFKYPKADCVFSTPAYESFDANGHYLMCSTCGTVSSTAKEAHKPVTAPTDDGRSHTTRCNFCGYTSGDPVPHTYNSATGECTECGFKPVAQDNAGNLYDSLQTAFQTVSDGGTITLTANITSSEDITFGEYPNDDGDWVKSDKSVTLVMNSYTLTGSTGQPALTVSGGSLTIADNATLNGRDASASSAELPASPAIKVTDGVLTFKGTVNATGGSGSSSAAPAIEVTGGKVIFEGDVTATGGLKGVSGNLMTCEPAIKATGTGELDFQGTKKSQVGLTLYGGLTVTGDATLTHGLTGGLFYSKPDGALSTTGYAVSVEGSNVYKNDKFVNVNKLLADKHVFVKISPEGENNGYLTTSYQYLAWDVTIKYHEHEFDAQNGYKCVCGVSCDHPKYVNGACTVCGKPCEHADATPRYDPELKDNVYTCDKCGLKMFVQNTKGDRGDWPNFKYAYFTNLNDAMAAATEDGWTVKLLDNIDQSNKRACLTGDGKTVTLDLNGKNITGGWIDVGSDQDGKVINSSRLNITGSGSFDGMISISAKGTLDLSDWDGGTIKTVDLSKRGNDECTLIVGEKAGTINTLSFYSWPSDTITKTKLTSGTYGSIPITKTYDGHILFSDLLAPGYAFQYTESGAFVDYEAKAEYSDGVSSLSNVKVVRCTSHVDANSNNRCDYCNTDLNTDVVATSETGGKTYYYTDLSDALAKVSTDGGTVKLLNERTYLTAPLTIENKNGHDITLDLNGNGIIDSYGVGADTTLLQVLGNVTICDSSDTKSGKIESPTSGGVCVSSGTLTITGGTFDCPVVVGNGGNMKISGGNFASLKTNGTAVSTLLADGYTLKYTDGSWLTEEELAASNAAEVTAVQAPIHSVTLTANDKPLTRNEDGWYTLSVEYGQPVTLNVSAQGPAATKYLTWYPVELNNKGEPDMTGQPLSDQKDKTTLDLSTLTIGKHAYAVSVSDDRSGNGAGDYPAGYQVISPIYITVEKIDLANATVTIDTWHADGKFRFYPYASETAALSPLSVVTVTANGKEDRLRDSDFTYTGATATRVGKYTLTITAKDSCANYKGSKTFDWEVIPFPLFRPAFQGSQTYTKTYDGTTTLPGSYTWLAEFSGKEGIDQNVTLKSGDYEVTAAEFVSADAGENKPINQTITLKNENFVFSPTEIIKIPGITTTDKTLTYTNFTPTEAYPTGGTTFHIEKAPMPDFDKEVTLDIVNDLAHTYTIDLLALPPLESPRTYGEIEYSQPTVQLASGYYTDGHAKVENGKLILTIDKNPVTTTGPIGTVTVKVTSTNYEDVTLTVNLNAVNKRKLGMFVSVATDPVVYGMTLGDIKLSAEATVNDQVIPGTIAWEDPLTTVPAAGRATYRWTFTPDDTMHYLTASNTINFLVDKATPTGAPTYTAITTGGKTLADASLTPNAGWPSGTVQWVDKDGKPLPASTQVQANTEYTWSFTPADTANYNGASGSVTLYAVTSGGGSSSGGGGGGAGSSSASKTTTTTNADGSVTKTETKADGTVIATTTAKDGSVTRIETKPDGSSVTQRTLADGSTGTVNTAADGTTRAEASISAQAVEGAKKSGSAVQVPTQVRAGQRSDSAPTVRIELPKNAGETKLEIPVENVNSGTVAVIVHEDGTEELVADSLPTETGVQLTLDGSATVKLLQNAKNFADTKDHWAKDAIDFVSARGLVSGMGGTTYAPDASTTRAQLWTILARQSGADLTGGATWYEKAQAWSKASGVSDGSDPNAAISRAQVVTMLWRAAGSPAAQSGTAFQDVAADSYYGDAVDWAVAHGITSGVGSGRFDPNGTCTRAQLAAFLMRSYQNQ